MKKLFQKERCFHLCDRRLDEILLHRFQPDANFLIEKSLISAKRNILTSGLLASFGGFYFAIVGLVYLRYKKKKQQVKVVA